MQNLSSAAVVIGALRVNIYNKIDHTAFIVCISMESSIGLKWVSKKERRKLLTCFAFHTTTIGAANLPLTTWCVSVAFI